MSNERKDTHRHNHTILLQHAITLYVPIDLGRVLFYCVQYANGVLGFLGRKEMKVGSTRVFIYMWTGNVSSGSRIFGVIV
jgi:hypothetical protein